MKIAIDLGKVHLRFVFGTGFVLFVVRKALSRKDADAAKALKPLGRDIKKLLKQSKRANGSLKLFEIKDKDKTHIVIKI